MTTWVLLYTLMDLPGYNPDQPMSAGAFWGVMSAIVLGLAALGASARTWYSFGAQKKLNALQIEKLKGEQAERDERNQEELVTRICKAVLEDRHYLIERDSNIIDLGRKLIEEEFKQRSPSFVSSDSFTTFREENDKRMKRIEDTVLSLRSDLRSDFRAEATRILKESGK